LVILTKVAVGSATLADFIRLIALFEAGSRETGGDSSQDKHLTHRGTGRRPAKKPKRSRK
jgi:hypothetical protein